MIIGGKLFKQLVIYKASEFILSNLFLFICLCRRVVILMELDVLKSAEAVGLKIGNPVPYNEGKMLFTACNTQMNIFLQIWNSTFWVQFDLLVLIKLVIQGSRNHGSFFSFFHYGRIDGKSPQRKNFCVFLFTQHSHFWHFCN